MLYSKYILSHFQKQFLKGVVQFTFIASISNNLVFAAEVIELDEITVTGTKRNQKVQEAVQSVAVFEEQDTIGMTTSYDVLKRMPNITVPSAQILPNIRGLDGNGVANGGNGAVTGARPRVVNYIDGVPRSYSAAPDTLGTLWDIKQIEVYLGSQSTQLGRNSIAGALVQTTNDPKFKDEYSAQFGLRDQDLTYNAAIMANKKISDQVAIRFTAETTKGANFVDYGLNDETVDFVTFSPLPNTLTSSVNNGAGNLKYTRFRFKTLLAPTEIPKLSVKLTLDSERNFSPNTFDAVNLTGRSYELSDRGSYSNLQTFNTVASVASSYAFNNEWLFDTILAYQRSKSSFLPPPGSNPNPRTFLDFTFSVHETTFEPKLSYQSSKNRTNAVLGAFYLKRTRNDFGKPETSFELDARDNSYTRSLFGDASIQVTDKWDILVGGRLENEVQKRALSSNALVVFGLPPIAFNFKAESNVFLPKIGATYHVTPDASLSLMAYKGYTSGGGGVGFDQFLPFTYRKETAQTIELVARSQWLNNSLNANANIFYTKFKDNHQIGTNPTNALENITINAKKARSSGAELMVSYQPTAKNSAFFSLGLLDTKLENFGDALNNVNNGNEFAFAPNVTARFGGSKEIYQNLVIGGDVNYTSNYYSTFENSNVDKIDSFSIANAYLRYRHNNVTVTGFVNNIFDKYAFTSIRQTFGTANVVAPRTVGVNVKLDF